MSEWGRRLVRVCHDMGGLLFDEPGKRRKIQQQTSRGSFDLGRLAPRGQWGGHETLSNISPLAAG